MLLTFFLCLQNQSISIHSIVTHVKEYRCLKNVTHQIDKNEWLLLSAFSARFTAKFDLVFVSTQKNAFLEVSF